MPADGPHLQFIQYALTRDQFEKRMKADRSYPDDPIAGETNRGGDRNDWYQCGPEPHNRPMQMTQPASKIPVVQEPAPCRARPLIGIPLCSKYERIG